MVNGEMIDVENVKMWECGKCENEKRDTT